MADKTAKEQADWLEGYDAAGVAEAGKRVKRALE